MLVGAGEGCGVEGEGHGWGDERRRGRTYILPPRQRDLDQICQIHSDKSAPVTGHSRKKSSAADTCWISSHLLRPVVPSPQGCPRSHGRLPQRCGAVVHGDQPVPA
jgi:hypothetical protein